MPSSSSSRLPPPPDPINTKVPPSCSATPTAPTSDPDPTFTLVQGTRKRPPKDKPLFAASSGVDRHATPTPSSSSPSTALSLDIAGSGKKGSVKPPTKSSVGK